MGSTDRSWIIVTGGVLSGLGKGVAAASIGNLLSDYIVTPIKCDGYLNEDPGTMNPLEHGEVFVLDDGGEVDMDFGHYERFLGVTCRKSWNITNGKIFGGIHRKERRGDYLGKTVQMIPHVTDYIKSNWEKVVEEEKSDVALIEIGGTVGDIEIELYLRAAQQLRSEGKNVLYVHLTYVPILANVNEQKSKPTQQSVALLQSRGIQPDIILARCEETLDEKIMGKIATFSGVTKDHVIPTIDARSVYEVPLLLEQEGMAKLLAQKMGLCAKTGNAWKRFVRNMQNPEREIEIAICGKYTKLEDSYASVVEALQHAGAKNKTRVNVSWFNTEEDDSGKLESIDGIIVPGGFGGRGVEGKIAVVKHCRENNVPFLGICYGLQMAVIEHARSLGLDANTTENDKDTAAPVVDILPEQEGVTEYGGTMRLGAYPAHLEKDSLVRRLYGRANVSERHRHRYEVNPKYHEQLEREGLVFSGMSPDGTLVEFLERDDHPYFVATQAHPELKSTPLKPAPLFDGLIKAAIKK